MNRPALGRAVAAGGPSGPAANTWADPATGRSGPAEVFYEQGQRSFKTPQEEP